MTSRRCSKCRLVKSTTEFAKASRRKDGLHVWCRTCVQLCNSEIIGQGLKILQSLAMTRGCCAHCQRQYTNEDWHFFEFDHIDSKIKRPRETDSKWVVRHKDEFFRRVASNLQLLCVKCHKIKSSKEIKLGGVVYQKIHGQSKPAEVLDPGWNLFNPVPVGGPDDLRVDYTALLKEGEWITVRDIDGNLIRYEPYSNYTKH